MHALYQLLSGLAWSFVALLPALTPAELVNLMAVVRRGISRIADAMWPDEPPERPSSDQR